MKLAIHVTPLSRGPANSLYPGLESKKPQDQAQKFIHLAASDLTIGQLWTQIEQAYRTKYLTQSAYGDFAIRKLQDVYDNDLDISFTLGELFEGEGGEKIIRVVQSRVDRECSIPITSSLRPAGLSAFKRPLIPESHPNKRRKLDEYADVHPDRPVLSRERSVEEGDTADDDLIIEDSEDEREHERSQELLDNGIETQRHAKLSQRSRSVLSRLSSELDLDHRASPELDDVQPSPHWNVFVKPPLPPSRSRARREPSDANTHGFKRSTTPSRRRSTNSKEPSSRPHSNSRTKTFDSERSEIYDVPDTDDEHNGSSSWQSHVPATLNLSRFQSTSSQEEHIARPMKERTPVIVPESSQTEVTSNAPGGELTISHADSPVHKVPNSQTPLPMASARKMQKLQDRGVSRGENSDLSRSPLQSGGNCNKLSQLPNGSTTSRPVQNLISDPQSGNSTKRRSLTHDLPSRPHSTLAGSSPTAGSQFQQTTDSNAMHPDESPELTKTPSFAFDLPITPSLNEGAKTRSYVDDAGNDHSSPMKHARELRQRALESGRRDPMGREISEKERRNNFEAHEKRQLESRRRKEQEEKTKAQLEELAEQRKISESGKIPEVVVQSRKTVRKGVHKNTAESASERKARDRRQEQARRALEAAREAEGKGADQEQEQGQELQTTTVKENEKKQKKKEVKAQLPRHSMSQTPDEIQAKRSITENASSAEDFEDSDEEELVPPPSIRAALDQTPLHSRDAGEGTKPTSQRKLQSVSVVIDVPDNGSGTAALLGKRTTSNTEKQSFDSSVPKSATAFAKPVSSARSKGFATPNPTMAHEKGTSSSTSLTQRVRAEQYALSSNLPTPPAMAGSSRSAELFPWLLNKSAETDSGRRRIPTYSQKTPGMKKTNNQTLLNLSRTTMIGNGKGKGKEQAMPQSIIPPSMKSAEIEISDNEGASLAGRALSNGIKHRASSLQKSPSDSITSPMSTTPRLPLGKQGQKKKSKRGSSSPLTVRSGPATTGDAAQDSPDGFRDGHANVADERGSAQDLSASASPSPVGNETSSDGERLASSPSGNSNVRSVSSNESVQSAEDSPESTPQEEEAPRDRHSPQRPMPSTPSRQESPDWATPEHLRQRRDPNLYNSPPSKDARTANSLAGNVPTLRKSRVPSSNVILERNGFIVTSVPADNAAKTPIAVPASDSSDHTDDDGSDGSDSGGEDDGETDEFGLDRDYVESSANGEKRLTKKDTVNLPRVPATSNNVQLRAPSQEPPLGQRMSSSALASSSGSKWVTVNKITTKPSPTSAASIPSATVKPSSNSSSSSNKTPTQPISKPKATPLKTSNPEETDTDSTSSSDDDEDSSVHSSDDNSSDEREIAAKIAAAPNMTQKAQNRIRSLFKYSRRYERNPQRMQQSLAAGHAYAAIGGQARFEELAKKNAG